MRRLAPVVILALLATLLIGILPAGAAFPGENGKILFVSYDEHPGIWVINPDGTGLEQVIFFETGSVDDPAWSPDGSKIAFSYGTEGSDIYVMNADGSGLTQLTTNGENNYYPCWSPDGAKIVFSSQHEGNDQIFVINANDGSGLVQLTDDEEIISFDPAWSPDGSKIAFASYDGVGTQIYVMNANDGSGLLQLTDDEDAESDHPAWSPDGSKIVFGVRGEPESVGFSLSSANGFRAERDLSALDSPGNWDIYTINPDGTGRVQLTNTLDVNENSPAWSPDGTKIAYVWSDNESNDIYVMNTDGGGQSNLTNNLGYVNFPDWQPIPVTPTPTPTPAPTVTPDPPAPPEVPEPGTMMLLASGLAGLGGLTAFRNRFRR